MYFGLPDQFQRCCAASGHGSEAELEELRERQRGERFILRSCGGRVLPFPDFRKHMSANCLCRPL